MPGSSEYEQGGQWVIMGRMSNSCLTSSLKPWFTLLLVVLSVLPCRSAFSEISVVTTIRPLQLIAEAIVQDRGEVRSLIGSQQSPHHFSIAPSGRLALDVADLVIWIGPDFEVHLADFFQSEFGDETLMTGTEAEGLILHSLNEQQIDSHLWLNSANGIALAREITRRIANVDQANGNFYYNNLRDFEIGVEEVHRSIVDTINVTMTDNKGAESRAPYIVYHDAYQYFEKEYGLTHELSLVEDPDSEPGIRAVMTARKRVRELSPGCLIVEPDSSIELIESIIQELPIRLVEMDLLGQAVTGKNGYSELLKNLANDFSSCL